MDCIPSCPDKSSLVLLDKSITHDITVCVPTFKSCEEVFLCENYNVVEFVGSRRAFVATTLNPKSSDAIVSQVDEEKPLQSCYSCITCLRGLFRLYSNLESKRVSFVKTARTTLTGRHLAKYVYQGPKQ